jgi:hypothetical protein
MHTLWPERLRVRGEEEAFDISVILRCTSTEMVFIER